MKKVLSLSLLLILGIFILCSCNKKPDNDTKQTSEQTSEQTSTDGVYDDSLPWGSLH
jgi:hypothetical protein